MKTILTSILAIIIATGTPVNHIECDYGKCINTYKENGIQYSAVQTSTGDLWIVEGKITKKKIWIGLQPSIEAASSISKGSPFIKPVNINTANPAPNPK